MAREPKPPQVALAEAIHLLQAFHGADPASFKAQLMNHLGIEAAAFEGEIKVMREYRDKFLAHLDSEQTMNI